MWFNNKIIFYTDISATSVKKKKSYFKIFLLKKEHSGQVDDHTECCAATTHFSIISLWTALKTVIEHC